MRTKSDTSKPRAVVLGLDTHTGLQTARNLARNQVPVIGIAGNLNHPFCRTWACEMVLAADIDGDGLISVLCDMGRSLERKAVLFPCTDLSVLTISRNRDRLEDSYHCVLPHPKTVEMLMKKAEFCCYAQKVGLAIPATHVLQSAADVEQAAKVLSYPAVIKPNLKSPAWQDRTSRKLFRADNAEQLSRVYDQCSKWGETLVAQDWIGGPESQLFHCMFYFGSDSRALVTFTYRKIRQWPPHEGSSASVVEVRNDAIVREASKVFADLNYVGFGHVELKEDERSGEFYIIEANIGRPAGSAALVEGAGVELRYTMYCDALALRLPERREQQYRGFKYVYGRLDFQSALILWLRKELTLRDWLASLRGPRVPGLYRWNDPLPFLGDLLYLLPTRPRHLRKAFQWSKAGQAWES